VELPEHAPRFRTLTKGAELADEAERAANPRAIPVRLRAAERERRSEERRAMSLAQNALQQPRIEEALPSRHLRAVERPARRRRPRMMYAGVALAAPPSSQVRRSRSRSRPPRTPSSSPSSLSRTSS
jgi:hypothetical protein